MRVTVLATTAVLAIAVSATASGQGQQNQPQGARAQTAQQCLNDLDAYNRQLTAASSRAGGYSAEFREDVRQLQQAARILGENGNEQGCQTVLSQLRQTVETHQQRASAETSGTARSERSADLQSAKSVEQHGGLLRAEDIIGADIRNPQNQDLGSIEDVVLNPQNGRIEFVLVSHGGFLGLGEDLTPVRWRDLSVTADGDTYVLNVPADTLENAPKVNQTTWRDRTANWAQDVESWWNRNIRG